MRHAREIVAADIGRERDVGLGVDANEIRRHAQAPEFRRAKGLHDFWAGLSRRAAVKQACLDAYFSGVGGFGSPGAGFGGFGIPGAGFGGFGFPGAGFGGVGGGGAAAIAAASVPVNPFVAPFYPFAFPFTGASPADIYGLKPNHDLIYPFLDPPYNTLFAAKKDRATTPQAVSQMVKSMAAANDG